MQVIIQGIYSVLTSSLTAAKQYAFGFETASLLPQPVPLPNNVRPL
jgi:hypothetical protein